MDLDGKPVAHDFRDLAPGFGIHAGARHLQMRAPQVQVHVGGQADEPVVFVEPAGIAPFRTRAEGGLARGKLQVRQEVAPGDPQAAVAGFDVVQGLGVVGPFIQRDGQGAAGLRDIEIQHRRRRQAEGRFQRQAQQIGEFLELDGQLRPFRLQAGLRFAALQVHAQHFRAGRLPLRFARAGQPPQLFHADGKSLVAFNLVAQVDQPLVKLHHAHDQRRSIPFPGAPRRQQRLVGRHDGLILDQRTEPAEQRLRHLHPHLGAAVLGGRVHLDLPHRPPHRHARSIRARRFRAHAGAPLSACGTHAGRSFRNDLDAARGFPRLLFGEAIPLQLQRPFHQIAVVRQGLLDGVFQRQRHRICSGRLRPARRRPRQRDEKPAAMESFPHAAKHSGFPRRGKIFSEGGARKRALKIDSAETRG